MWWERRHEKLGRTSSKNNDKKKTTSANTQYSRTSSNTSAMNVQKFRAADRAEFVDLILGEMLTMAVETTAGAQPHNIFIYMTTLYVSLNAATTSYMLSSELPSPQPRTESKSSFNPLLQKTLKWWSKLLSVFFVIISYNPDLKRLYDIIWITKLDANWKPLQTMQLYNILCQ